MGIPGGWELVAILAVLVLLFGASKLPTAARSIGQSMRIFKAETKGMRSDEDGGEQASRGQTQQPAPPQNPPQALPPSAQQAPTSNEHQTQHHTDSR